MFTTLIRRELLDNLMTFRFAAALFIMLLLVVANTAVLIKDYERRLADYNTAVKTHQEKLREKKNYMAGLAEAVVLDRPPNPLSIFNVGLDKRLGNQIWIPYDLVPTLWDAGMHGADNPLFNIFTSIDIVFIFEVVLSLMALIFAYDAIAGEHERGTLRLVLTNSIRRGHILLAKYLSAMICLLVPLVMSLLLALILLTTSTAIALSADDFLRIGGIVLSSLAYLSVFYLIGMLISAATRRTSTALMLAMFVWAFLLLIYPNMILTVAETAAELPQDAKARRASAFNQIEQLWEEFDRQRLKFLRNDPVPGEEPDLGIHGLGAVMADFERYQTTLRYHYYTSIAFREVGPRGETLVPHAKDYFGFLTPLMIKTAEKTWPIRESALKDIYVQQAETDRMWLNLSPIGMYDAATQAWTGTDWESIQDFFEAVRQWRLTLVDYLLDTEVFASREWFLSDKEEADWSTLPPFSYQRSGVAINAKRALPHLFLLVLTNLVLFMAIFLVFVRSEV